MNNEVTGGSYNLEIDCYNHELRLGVEYDGAQHYKYNPYFHKNKEAFYNQKYRDKLKEYMCKENNIVLNTQSQGHDIELIKQSQGDNI